MKIKTTTFHNYGTIETQLSSQTIDIFWKLIDEAKNNPVNMNSILAGQISSSLRLNMHSQDLEDFNQQTIPKLVNTYIETFKSIPVKYNNADRENLTLELEDLWVNFQKEHEFNPIHDHNGAFSFVIWMKIPYDSKKQNQKDIARNSNSPLIGSFNFCYAQIQL